MNDIAKNLVDGYRELANFIEAHPDELAWPKGTFSLNLYDEYDTADNVARVARLLAPVKKEFTEGLLDLTRQCSESIVLKVVFLRSAVCTKRVIGTKRIEAQFIPAHDEEIVEWDCEPILEHEKAEPAGTEAP